MSPQLRIGQGANETDPLVRINFSIRTSNTCQNNTNCHPLTSCKSRCTGAITPTITFEATFTDFASAEDVFMTGVGYLFRACGQEAALVYEAPNYPINSGEKAIKASIPCPSLNCCGDWLNDKATIRRNKNSPPTIIFNWGISTWDCGDECFDVSQPKLGLGDFTGPHQWVSNGGSTNPNDTLTVSGGPQCKDLAPFSATAAALPLGGLSSLNHLLK